MVRAMRFTLLATLLLPATVFATTLSGTAKFTTCSGFLFTVDGRAPDAPAWVMTNGHCLDPLGLRMLAPGEIKVDVPSVRDIKLNGDTTILSIKTRRLVYASMTRTDMAIYELGVDYRRLAEKYNIHPLMLASEGPTAGTAIDIASSYRHRVYNCHVDEVLFGLREGGRSFVDSIRYDQDCHTIGGTSGSPMILAGTQTVVGINNTVNTSGGSCGNDNPCEVNADGSINVIRGRAYGQQTALLYTCLDEAKNFALDRPGCLLAK